jgi:hypothetical protein
MRVEAVKMAAIGAKATAKRLARNEIGAFMHGLRFTFSISARCLEFLICTKFPRVSLASQWLIWIALTRA